MLMFDYNEYELCNDVDSIPDIESLKAYAETEFNPYEDQSYQDWLEFCEEIGRDIYKRGGIE